MPGAERLLIGLGLQVEELDHLQPVLLTAEPENFLTARKGVILAMTCDCLL